jgi:hypothetical protein
VVGSSLRVTKVQAMRVLSTKRKPRKTPPLTLDLPLVNRHLSPLRRLADGGDDIHVLCRWRSGASWFDDCWSTGWSSHSTTAVSPPASSQPTDQPRTNLYRRRRAPVDVVPVRPRGEDLVVILLPEALGLLAARDDAPWGRGFTLVAVGCWSVGFSVQNSR